MSKKEMSKTSNISVVRFTDAIEKMDENLKAISSGGKKVFGYFCTYTPIEMIHAAGFLPVRIAGGQGRVDNADSLTPNFICPYVRLATERALMGRYDYLSGVIEGYTCDVVCGAVNVWEDNFKGELYHTIPLPYDNYPADRDFFGAVLEELKDKLEGVGGAVTEESLEVSLDLYGKIRGMILRFMEMREKRSLPLTAAEFLTVIRAGFVTPPEDYLLMLEGLAGEIEEKGDKAETINRKGIPVLVSGSLVEEPGVLEILEESGGVVVADDLCTGFRNFHPEGGEGKTSTERLIDRYINRYPCPSRSRTGVRVPRLVELVKSSGAKGVVFLFQKFCSPHLADHPVAVEMLKKEGIPQIAIEMEETGIMEGQLRTRLEGFFEMIGS
ncbi:MAG: 2-hydroxyacyl-CoA dehydratase [Deltaproteobacteria bacterium]|uniref:2-hydroxyacyl-CoA dehydratase n=1 Tax=Candidatus Zymogenus saltonus TaxID=2844893 RepID=A0A9D8KJP0_9DELT|nr:2-hydroxyacyl-CoA dehydratase [Candidatus Zymogenus saltonus]